MAARGQPFPNFAWQMAPPGRSDVRAVALPNSIRGRRPSWTVGQRTPRLCARASWRYQRLACGCRSYPHPVVEIPARPITRQSWGSFHVRIGRSVVRRRQCAQSHVRIRDRLTSTLSLASSMYSRCDGDQKNAAGAVSFFGQRPAFFWTAICVIVLWDRNDPLALPPPLKAPVERSRGFLYLIAFRVGYVGGSLLRQDHGQSWRGLGFPGFARLAPQLSSPLFEARS